MVLTKKASHSLRWSLWTTITISSGIFLVRSMGIMLMVLLAWIWIDWALMWLEAINLAWFCMWNLELSCIFVPWFRSLSIGMSFKSDIPFIRLEDFRYLTTLWHLPIYLSQATLYQILQFLVYMGLWWAEIARLVFMEYKSILTTLTNLFYLPITLTLAWQVLKSEAEGFWPFTMSFVS